MMMEHGRRTEKKLQNNMLMFIITTIQENVTLLRV